MDNTLKQLDRLKVDCLYGKKKHFIASDRKAKYHKCIGIPLIALNVISGSVLLYVLVSSVGSFVKWIPLIFTVVSAVLSGIQTFFNFQKHAEGHKSIGNRYLSVYKQVDVLIALYNDKHLEDESLVEKLLELQREASQINKDAEMFPTSSKDYKLARNGIKDGEETYTTNELSM